MAAAISFLAGEGFTIDDLSGSGLGFYGDGFGASVRVGEFASRVFITNGAGTTQGPEVDSFRYLNAASGIVGQTGSGIALTCLPNYLAPLQIKFTYDTPVKVQNAVFRIYDRSNINLPASGVTVKVCEVIHPTQTQLNNGSGDTTWITAGGSGVTVTLANSPGVSGLYAGNGSNSLWTDKEHSFFLAISPSPDSIGSKTQFAGYCSLEYL